MNVVWKRPDGFHGATPQDFLVVDLGSHSNLWLHKRDKDTFPFRISGGWEEKDGSTKLNNLINLIGSTNKQWVEHLAHTFSHSMKDEPEAFLNELVQWVQAIKGHLKGDKWEVEIMGEAVDTVAKKLEEVRTAFLAAAS